MDYVIKYWAENTDYFELKTRIGKRKVAVWGAYVGGKNVKNILSDHGITTSFYIDGHKDAEIYDELPILKPYKIECEEVYIIVAVIGVRDEIIRYLREWSMEEEKDYRYISQTIPRFTITECTGGGIKCNGNSLENAEDIKCKIEFMGLDNKIKIGKGFQVSEKTYITVENGCEIAIGDNVCLKGVHLEVLEGGKLEIGNGCLCYEHSKISSKGGKIIIGDYVTMGERFWVSNGKSSDIYIGNDCMFAADVSIISGGHSIFDLSKKENISLKKEKQIKIGNHVWLGKNVVVLHNAEIGEGCVVGASSVVKLKTDNNCILAGNPAKVIQTNHTWDRRRDIKFEDL